MTEGGNNMKSKEYKNKYQSLTEFALFGGDDEEIDLKTLIAVNKKKLKDGKK